MVILDLCIDLLDSYKLRNEYKVDLNVMARWILITLFENRALFIGFSTQIFVDISKIENTGINGIITSYN